VPGYQLARALRDFVRRDRRLVAPLERFFRERKVDLIHLNNGLRYHRADLLVAGRLGIPAVCHVRAFQPLTPLERFLGRRVRRFIYISRAIGADYERQGIAPERGLVVHNVVSVPAAPGEEARAKLRAEFGWDRSHFIAVNVGRLVPWKGQDVFLRAVRAAAASLPRLRALVVGAADPNQKSRAYASGLEALAREAGLAGRVVFAGHRADVPALFAAADVAVHSATKPEPFGRVIIEAMAAGTAVVAAEDGGVAEIVAPETDGVLVPPGDAEALARALLGLAGDDARRRRLAAAGKARVERHFSVENQVRQIEQAYEACVAR
jgi:glycosyltransferase involved in cell wall biosynthesis